MSEEDVKEQRRRQDMRWQRTERHLMEEFGAALATTPLEKITVAGLARAAEINTATFYRHYRDVYDLADAYVEARAAGVVQELGDDLASFFTDPRTFVKALVAIMDREMGNGIADTLTQNGLIPQLMNSLTRLLDKRFQAIHPVLRGAEPAIVISFFVHGALGALAQHRDADRDMLVGVVSELLVALEERGKARDAAMR